MPTCHECGGLLLPFSGEASRTLICENLMAKAIERHKAGDTRTVTHADLRDGIEATPMLKRIEERCRTIGKAVGEAMPEGYGFLVAIFRMNGPEFTWISNAQRDDMIRAMREFTHRLAGDQAVTVDRAKLLNTLAYCWVRGWYAGTDGAVNDDGKIAAAKEELKKLLGEFPDRP